MKFAVILISASVSCATTAVFAQGTPEQRAACRPDVRKFCSKIPDGSDANTYLRCLQANSDKLSPKCRVVITGQ